MSKLAQSILRPAFINTRNILLSRITGLGRDILAAAYWGTTEIAQAAYTTAFSVSNTFRSLFAEGAFANAFVPLLSKKLKEGKQKEAWALACQAITLQGVLLLAIIALTAILSAIVLHCLPESTDDTLTRRIFQILPLLIPYALFICIAGSFASILNALQHFAIPSATPIIFNIVQISTLTLLYICGKTRQEFSSLIFYCFSTLLAGLLQAGILMLVCRKKGFIFHLDFHWKDSDLLTLIKRIGPALIGAGAHQLNVFADRTFAAILGAVAIGAINYADRIIFLPVGIFGVAMNTVCLAKMSRASQDEMADCLDTALRQVLALALPCTAIIAALNADIIRLLFMRGAFNEDSVRECAWALACYLPGLPAFCAVKVATTTHHGRGDTKTPMLITILCVCVNCALNYILIQHLRQGGLALASAISQWLNVLMLLAIDTRKIPDWHYGRTFIAFLKLTVAAAVCGAAAMASANLLRPMLASLPATVAAILLIAAVGLISGIVYLIVCKLLRQNEMMQFLMAVGRRVK